MDLTSLHLEQAAGGEPASQAWLVERFTPVLLAQARYRLQGRLGAVCEPLDLVQDVWAIALPRLRDLQPRDGRWTPVLLRFLATTLLRRVNLLVRKHLTAGRPLAGDGEALPSVSAAISGAITRLHRAEVVDAVRSAMAALPDLEREVMVLRGIEQLANRAVAQQLGIDDYQVTRRYQRALVLLGEALPGSLFAELD